MNDMVVVLGLSRSVVESLGFFDEKRWQKSRHSRPKFLLHFCLNAISYFQGDCGGCGVCSRKMTAKERGRIDYHHERDEEQLFKKYFVVSDGHRYPSFFIIAELRKCVGICRNCHSFETLSQNETKRARLS